MVLEVWMIGVLFLWWIVSVIHISTKRYEEGSKDMLEFLISKSVLTLDSKGEIEQLKGLKLYENDDS